MSRTARAAAAGVCYHVINRGNNRARVFNTRREYREFIELMCATQRRIPLDLFAACLMPNHFHFVMRANADEDMGRWIHWLLTTHASRRRDYCQPSGHIWQGRFKAFPVEQDEHLLTVVRYVERNALRANLVPRAEDWAWGSLNWRMNLNSRIRLSACPVPLPNDWVDFVNEPQSEEELTAVRISVNRQRPYGSPTWVKRTATRLGLESSLRPRGRPKKSRRGRS